MSFWNVWVLVALADAALSAFILYRDGGPENTVWWVFLIIPIGLVLAALGRMVFGLVAR